MVKTINKDYLLASYGSFLIDAYGVLVRAGEVIPGAVDFIRELLAQQKEFLLLSNDASRSVESTWRKYQDMGFPFTPDHIVTSGMMIAPFFAENGLQGARTLVLGPPDSDQLARQAGAEVVGPFATDRLEAVVICDERQEHLIEALNYVAGQIVNASSPEDVPRIILANPDLLYPMGDGNVGLTAGSLAAMMQTWLDMRFGADAPVMDVLGKPSPYIFQQALKLLSHKTPVMIGDQIVTDIAGSHACQLRCCLSLMGMVKELAPWHDPQPHYILQSWS